MREQKPSQVTSTASKAQDKNYVDKVLAESISPPIWKLKIILALLIPIAFYSLSFIHDKQDVFVNYSPNFIFYSAFLQANENSFLNFGFLAFIALSPLLSITLSEFIRLWFSKKDLSTMSILKIGSEEGYRFVDIWYFGFRIITGKLPILIAFATLSSSMLSEKINIFLNTLFDLSFFKGLPYYLNFTIFIASLIILDFLDFFKHYLSHKLPIIWDSHEAHHAAKHMTSLNTKRGVLLGASIINPIFLPFYVFFGSFVAMLLQQSHVLPFILWFIWNVYVSINDDLCHSSLKILYPYPINLILLSPSLHWLHHSTNRDHYDSNFSSSTPVWDKLFGTYLGEQHLEDVVEFGVPGSEYTKHHPAYCFFIIPVIKLIKRLKTAFSMRSLKPLIRF